MNKEIAELRAEIERLEREAQWLAKACANGDWHGLKLGPKYWREMAKKACEQPEGK